jgi:hypothetical protein
MNINKALIKAIQDHEDKSAIIASKLTGILHSHTVDKLSSELNAVDSRINGFIKSIDEILSQKNVSRETRREFKQIKEKLESERPFFQLKTSIVSAYQKLYSKVPEIQELLDQVVLGVEKGVISKAFKDDLNKLLKLLGKVDIQKFTRQEVLALADLHSKITQVHFDNTLETVTAKAAPILNQPDQQAAARTAFKTGHFPAVESVIEKQRMEKTGQLQPVQAIAAVKVDQAALDSVKKAVPFLFDDFEHTEVSAVEYGNPLVKYLLLTNPSLGRLEIKLEDWQKADKTELRLTRAQLSRYEKLASGQNPGFTYKARVSKDDARVPTVDYFIQREIQDYQKLSTARVVEDDGHVPPPVTQLKPREALNTTPPLGEDTDKVPPPITQLKLREAVNTNSPSGMTQKERLGEDNDEKPLSITQLKPREALNEDNGSLPTLSSEAQNRVQMQDNAVEAGRQLSYAEKLAINIYSGDGYQNANRILRGCTTNAKGANMSSSELKEAMAHAVTFAQTFPKLPDFVDQSQRRWRGELAGEMRRDQLIAMIDRGEHVVDNYSFTSVSYAETENASEGPSRSFFKEKSPWGTVFTEPVGGKLITPWSQYQTGEREVVLSPGQFYFEGYYKAGNLTLFKAKPIIPKQ